MCMTTIVQCLCLEEKLPGDSETQALSTLWLHRISRPLGSATCNRKKWTARCKATPAVSHSRPGKRITPHHTPLAMTGSRGPMDTGGEGVASWMHMVLRWGGEVRVEPKGGEGHRFTSLIYELGLRWAAF